MLRWLIPLFLLGCGGSKGGAGDDTGGSGAHATDLDRDGSPAGEDCDDQDAAVYPGAQEVCDGEDDDCDGFTDGDDPDLDLGSWYWDDDADGYGDDAREEEALACEAPEGMSSVGGDCDDDDPAYHPGADEADCADPNDYDCDGVVSYADEDGDGRPACQDCDDANPDVTDASAEVCDGLDNDCDGLTDADDPDTPDVATWYRDGDDDGYGSSSTTTRACDQPEGYVDVGGDCVDTSADIHPGATEVCGGADDDCDGLVDDDDPDVSEGSAWYRDDDEDGYGLDAATISACDAPDGYAETGGDCDDDDEAINPDADETCDGVDDDCDGWIDDDDPDLIGALSAYIDSDGDGYGADGTAVARCRMDSGYATEGGDCDDTSAAISPLATDTCDGVDNDCSDYADDGGDCPCSVVYDDDHPYMLCTSYRTWSDAEAYCEKYGYTLVSVDDSSEDAFVYEAAHDTSRYGSWWIGLSDSASEGSWVWVDGTTASYTDWASGQPDDAYGGQDCGAFLLSYSSQWYDLSCSSYIFAICEAE